FPVVRRLVMAVVMVVEPLWGGLFDLRRQFDQVFVFFPNSNGLSVGGSRARELLLKPFSSQRLLGGDSSFTGLGFTTIIQSSYTVRTH
ncbi:hypothetical protein A2U01_0027383, partial [Trifolium medium]|nr:hypothetical protein [Trifolium medium]